MKKDRLPKLFLTKKGIQPYPSPFFGNTLARHPFNWRIQIGFSNCTCSISHLDVIVMISIWVLPKGYCKYPTIQEDNIQRSTLGGILSQVLWETHLELAEEQLASLRGGEKGRFPSSMKQCSTEMMSQKFLDLSHPLFT